MFKRRDGKSIIKQFGDYRLMYRTYGEGPPVVLIHGLSGSGNWWKHNIPALAEHFCVYVVELVGYGHNRSWRPVRIAKTADCLGEFVQQVPEGRPHIIGHSMGGQISTHLAARHADYIDKLVLVAASGMVGVDLLHMMLRLPNAGRYSRFDFAPTLALDALRAGPLNLLLSTLDILSNDVSDALKKITAPTLLVWGTHDKLVPVTVGQVVQQALPNARLQLIKNAGHVPMWDRPQEFNRIVLDFLLHENQRAV